MATQLTNQDIDLLIGFGQNQLFYIPSLPLPLGVSKFQVFLSLKPLLKGANYWYALRSAYEMSDNLFEYRFDLQLAFRSDQPYRQEMMSTEEKEFLAGLPEEVTVYRGMTKEEFKSGQFGVSWTLDKKRAEFFAFQYFKNPNANKRKSMVHSIVVPKSKILAYLNDREEQEVIIANDLEILYNTLPPLNTNAN